jgi:Golgi phosphoprotein 3
MASAGGLTRRRGAAQAATDGEDSSSGRVASPAPKSTPSFNDRSPETSYSSGENGHKIAFDPRDISESEERSKQPKLTLMEEILLLGLKDKQVRLFFVLFLERKVQLVENWELTTHLQGYLSFWNDNISYALRGCIVIELAFRGRVSMQKDSSRRRFPLPDRVIEVIDDTLTGEVLLDETLKMMKSSEKMSVSSWIDLLSGACGPGPCNSTLPNCWCTGETWNLMKIGYQLKQVRERLAKGLVDKGILRTEKRNFLLFDMATHPVVDAAAKDEIRKRVRNVCSSRTVVLPASQFLPEDLEFRYLRTISMVCAAYAANVLENALATMSHEARERAFAQVDELLAEYSQWPFGKRAGGGQGIGANLGQVIGQEVERNNDKELQLEVSHTLGCPV